MGKVTDEMVQVFSSGIGVRHGLKSLFNANLIALPADESAIRESVVREAMALFDDKNAGWNGAGVQKRLQSLLPTKDRAEELVQQWFDDGARMSKSEHDGAVAFARWLIEREGVNG